MNVRTLSLMIGATVWFGCAARGPQPVEPPHLPAVASSDVTTGLVVADLNPGRTAVSGVIVNNTPYRVGELQLLIRNTWLWQKERHPGKLSPSRAEYDTLNEEVPPGGKLPFTYQFSKPLPHRSGGRFQTQVDVVGFTEATP